MNLIFKDTYDVVLENVGQQPIATMKVLCSLPGVGLAKAKDMVDKTPTTVAKGLDGEKAIALKRELEALGNTVSIPGMKTNEETPATAENVIEKKNVTKKTSAPSSLPVTTPVNDEFDAIFGVSTTQRATALAKTKDSVKSMVKSTTGKVSPASNAKFDTIFGNSEQKKRE